MATASISALPWTQRSDLRAVVLVAVGAAGALATAATVWAVAHSPILVDRTGDVVWRGLFVAAYVAVGGYSWWRRPESRLGPLVAGSGFLYAATSMNASGVPLVYTLGMVVWAVYIVYTGYLYLCFPRGWLESQLERRFMLAFVLSTGVVWGLILLLSPRLPAGSDFTNCGTSCPHNALQIATGHVTLGMALVTSSDIVLTIAAIGVAMLVFHKSRSSGRLRRRTLTPLAVILLASIAEFVVSLFLPSAFPGTTETLKVINGLLTVALPGAIFAGQARGDVFAARSLGQIAMRSGEKTLTPAAAQKLIREALGDATITLALWAPERDGYVDVDGGALELPSDPRVRAVTRVTRNDRPVAALIHDPTLDTDTDMVDGLAATSLMLLENTRLVEELRASRARIVATVDRERRRLEQDLHDGAQQRIVGIQVKLRLVEEDVAGGDLSERLGSIRVDAEEAVDDLRTLSHGIYPPLLRDRGLTEALRSLALRAPIPIRVRDESIGRCSAPVEAAIYFCSLEAVQNTIKHAGTGARVTVALGRDRGSVQFSVADDGVGMDSTARRDGFGLVGMRDRIGAVGGDLEIVSSPGQGTIVRGTVPEGGSETALVRSEEPG